MDVTLFSAMEVDLSQKYRRNEARILGCNPRRAKLTYRARICEDVSRFMTEISELLISLKEQIIIESLDITFDPTDTNTTIFIGQPEAYGAAEVVGHSLVGQAVGVVEAFHIPFLLHVHEHTVCPKKFKAFRPETNQPNGG